MCLRSEWPRGIIVHQYNPTNGRKQGFGAPSFGLQLPSNLMTKMNPIPKTEKWSIHPLILIYYNNPLVDWLSGPFEKTLMPIDVP